MEKGALPLRGVLHFLLQLKTTTTAVISKDFTEDQIWINGQKEDIGQPRIQACLRQSEWESHMGHGGQSQPLPSPSLLWVEAETTAGATVSALPT